MMATTSKNTALFLLALAMASSAARAQEEPSFAITTRSYALQETVRLKTACSDEFGAGARTTDLDQDLSNHKWSTIERHLPALQRFTHYWALADSDYLDALTKSRGVVLEYLWGAEVEPVLMGDGEMPGVLKVQVLCRIPGGARKPSQQQPLAVPTITAGSYGHLHVTTWAGETMDLKNTEGSCRLTLLENPHFLDHGITVQVRTKATPLWSYIESAVVQIGQDRLEVAGGQDDNHYWVNGEYQGNLNELAVDVKFHQVNARQRDFVVDFGEGTLLKFKTFHKYVRVDLQTPLENAELEGSSELEGSFGLMGSFPGGQWIGKDRVTLMDTPTQLGMEWANSANKDLFATPSATEDLCAFQIVSGASSHRQDKGELRDAVQKLQQNEEELLGDIRATRRRLTEGGAASLNEMTKEDAQTACEKVHNKDHPERVASCVQGLLDASRLHEEQPGAEEGVFADVYRALFDKEQDNADKKE